MKPRPEAPRPDAAAAEADRRTVILEAALACFNRLGFANATIDDVRRASGASVGSIYHHFGDKEGIAGALYVEGLRRYQWSLLARVAGADGRRGARGAEKLIRGIVTQTIDWMLGNPGWSKFLLEMRGVEGVVAVEETIRRDTREFFLRLGERMERHVERGEIRPMSMEVLGAVLVGPAQELVRHWLRAGAPANVKKIREELADAAWRAVRPGQQG